MKAKEPTAKDIQTELFSDLYNEANKGTARICGGPEHKYEFIDCTEYTYDNHETGAHYHTIDDIDTMKKRARDLNNFNKNEGLNKTSKAIQKLYAWMLEDGQSKNRIELCKKYLENYDSQIKNKIITALGFCQYIDLCHIISCVFDMVPDLYYTDNEKAELLAIEVDENMKNQTYIFEPVEPGTTDTPRSKIDSLCRRPKNICFLAQ